MRTVAAELVRIAAPSAPGDPVEVVAAIIAAADTVPLRLTLGSGARAMGADALRRRLTALENAKDLACSTEADDHVAS